jgi:hypothetical protein
VGGKVGGRRVGGHSRVGGKVGGRRGREENLPNPKETPTKAPSYAPPPPVPSFTHPHPCPPQCATRCAWAGRTCSDVPSCSTSWATPSSVTSSLPDRRRRCRWGQDARAASPSSVRRAPRKSRLVMGGRSLRPLPLAWWHPGRNKQPTVGAGGGAGGAGKGEERGEGTRVKKKSEHSTLQWLRSPPTQPPSPVTPPPLDGGGPGCNKQPMARGGGGERGVGHGGSGIGD